MASLRFTYDAERRQERRTPVSPFPPRMIYPFAVPMQKRAVVLPVEPSPEEPASAELPAAAAPEEGPAKQETVENTVPEKGTEEKQTVSVSEKFISRLDNVETGLAKTRGHVDTLKIFTDEAIYVLDSCLQIMAVLRANEERKLAGPQVSLTSTKSGQDTIDDFLALLQTPAVQSILRQFMVSLLVKR